MEILVAVIAHEHQGVLPGSGIGVLLVVDGLVHQYLGFLHRGHRESSYRHILQFGFRIGTLPLADDSQPAVAHIAGGLAERVIALMTEQVIIRIQQPAFCREHPVVPYAVAEEQKILRHVSSRSRPVAQHPQIAAVGIGIGGTAGEFIIEFIGGHDIHAQPVVGFVEFLEPLCLLEQFLRGWDDDDHVGSPVGMVILLGDAIHILGCRNLTSETGKRRRLLPGYGYIIQMNRSTADWLYLDGILLPEILKRIGGAPFHAYRIGTAAGIGRQIEIQGSQFLLVLPDLHLGVGAGGNSHHQLSPAASGRIGDDHLLGIAHLDGCRMEEIPSTLHPAEPIYFIKRMIIFRHRMAGRDERG